MTTDHTHHPNTQLYVWEINTNIYAQLPNINICTITNKLEQHSFGWELHCCYVTNCQWTLWESSFGGKKLFACFDVWRRQQANTIFQLVLEREPEISENIFPSFCACVVKQINHCLHFAKHFSRAMYEIQIQ